MVGVVGVMWRGGCGGAERCFAVEENGGFGRNVLGEALLVGLRGASLEEFAGNGWFFGGEADGSWLRGASLVNRMLVLAEMFYVKRFWWG